VKLAQPHRECMKLAITFVPCDRTTINCTVVPKPMYVSVLVYIGVPISCHVKKQSFIASVERMEETKETPKLWNSRHSTSGH
jgi:hypothetical protein